MLIISFSFFLALVSLYPIGVGWAALVRQKSRFLAEDRWQRESGLFGLGGSTLLAFAGYLILTMPRFYLFGTPGGADSVGAGSMMWLVAVISAGMCGLCWFSTTRLAYHIDNTHWLLGDEYLRSRVRR